MHVGWTVALAALLATSAAAAQGPVKTLRIVVGFSVGGGYDTYARMLSRHMGRHLPGTSVVLVQNMPGAAGLKALQYLDTGAPTDGSVITAFNPGSITEFLVNPVSHRFNFTDVAWIGSISRDLRACYAWAATGIKTLDDLKRYKQFNMGAPAPGTSSYINSAVLKNVFGVAVHHVMGYIGSAEQRLAVERGELDGDCGAWSSLPPDWIAGRKITPLLRFSPGPIPGLPPDIPFARDLAPTQAPLLVALSAQARLSRFPVSARRPHFPPPRALGSARCLEALFTVSSGSCFYSGSRRAFSRTARRWSGKRGGLFYVCWV